MSTSGGVLSLDLAGTIGWAYGTLDDINPTCGCWVLPRKMIEGGRFVALENMLAGAVDTLRPSEIIVEASLSLQALARSSNIRITCQQLTLRGIAHMEAYRANIPISEVTSFDVRRDIIGVGRFKKGEAKDEVMAACRLFGWDVPDHNAADACLTWAWRTRRIRGEPPVAGRLFAQVKQ